MRDDRTTLLPTRSHEGRANYRIGFLAGLAIAQRWLNEGRSLSEYVAWVEGVAAVLASIEEGEEAPCHFDRPSSDAHSGRRHQR